MTHRIFIYGSCVTRDSVEFWDPKQLEMTGYVARQSLISAMSPAGDAEAFRLSQISSPFQRRMLRGDVESSLLTTLEEQKDQYDFILWDLTDERNGVQRLPHGGWVTRLRNFQKEQLFRGKLGPNVTPGDGQHAILWNHALDKFLAELDRLSILDRLVLNDTRWATEDDLGEPFSERACFLNPHLAAMSSAIRSAGVPVIGADKSTVVASSNHKWERAPFHYVDATYQSLNANLLAFGASTR